MKTILILTLGWMVLSCSAAPSVAAPVTKLVTVTAYCPCAKCCGKWAGGPTASGKMPKAGVTVAGPRAFKLGTKVQIPGIGSRIIQDRLAKKFDDRIDLFCASHAEALKWGKRQLLVTFE